MSITAKFAGTCYDCGTRYPEGTRIQLVEGRGWTHDGKCPDSQDLMGVQPGEVSCPDCFLIHPAGECDR